MVGREFGGEHGWHVKQKWSELQGVNQTTKTLGSLLDMRKNAHARFLCVARVGTGSWNGPSGRYEGRSAV